MNNNDYILVIDSGNGGKYTLKYLVKELPNENFIYFEDDRNLPYGKKSKSRLRKIAKFNLEYIFKNYKIKMIILACNTLSSCAYDYIKNLYSDIFVLPVFPNLENLKNKTLLLCTTTTKKYNKNLKKSRRNKNLFILSFKDLALKIDKNIENLYVLQDFLNKKLVKYAEMNISDIVIGCTHYNYIRKEIKNALLYNPYVITKNNFKELSEKQNEKIFGEIIDKNNVRVFIKEKRKINFFENSKNVSKQAVKLLTKSNLKNMQNNNGKILYLKSSEVLKKSSN